MRVRRSATVAALLVLCLTASFGRAVAARGSPQHGIQVLWYDNPAESDSAVQDQAVRIADYIAGMGANALAVSFPFYTPGLQANDVSASGPTPTPQRLRLLVDEATKRGLRVMLRPLLDQGSLAPGWRGLIKPANRDKWFSSLERFLEPYLRMANDSEVTSFTLGSELGSMERDPHWADVVRLARSLFSGELSYSANWDRLLSGVDMPVDTVGLDTYFPLATLSNDATVEEIKAGWNAWLDKLLTYPSVARAPIHEVGIAAQKGAYAHPWAQTNDPFDFEVQRRWYAAVCAVVRERHMRGVYFWALEFHQDFTLNSPDVSNAFSVVNRPAENEIRACFNAGSATN
jgi:hypothetical protein